MKAFSTSIRDDGPIYAETLPGRFPVEPWATFTNLVFLFTIVYWGMRIRRSRLDYSRIANNPPLRGRARHWMLRFVLVGLGIGWFGGTVYHATRSSNLWLAMDWMPIMLLGLTAAFWLWRGITGRTLWAAIAMAVSLRFISLGHDLAHSNRTGFHISLSYSLLALTILVPAFVHCALRWRAGWWRIVCALLAFGVAIAARMLDKWAAARFLPMGSHFLWHIFGGISAFCMISYIFGAGEANPAAGGPPESLRFEKRGTRREKDIE